MWVLTEGSGIVLVCQFVVNVLERTLEHADQAIAEGRDAVYDLRSSATTTNDLAEAVRLDPAETAALLGVAVEDVGRSWQA